MSKCRRCADCCRYVYVPVVDLDHARLLSHRPNIQIVRWANAEIWAQVYSPCVHLRDGHCDIYDHRPRHCREWNDADCYNWKNGKQVLLCELSEDEKWTWPEGGDADQPRRSTSE